MDNSAPLVQYPVHENQVRKGTAMDNTLDHHSPSQPGEECYDRRKTFALQIRLNLAAVPGARLKGLPDTIQFTVPKLEIAEKNK